MSEIIDPQETGHTYHRKEIFDEELGYINDRRSLNNLDPVPGLKNSWGICFSGGGIRSATLCLGILQRFTRENIFRFFDFLSTVSGGGYIGSCLSTLLSKSPVPDAPFNKVVTGVDPDSSPFVGLNKYDDYEDADKTKIGVMHQMHHLRTHGEYLIPDKDILSRDLQRAVGTIFTGILHHVVLFCLLLISLTALLHFVLFSITKYPEKAPAPESYINEIPLLSEFNYSSKDYYKINEGVLTALKSEDMSDNMINHLKRLEGKVFFKGEKEFLSELGKIPYAAENKELILKYASDPGDSQLAYLKNIAKTWLYSRIGEPLYRMFYKGIKSNFIIYGIFFVIGILWSIATFFLWVEKVKRKINKPGTDNIESVKSGFNLEDHYESGFIFLYNIVSFSIAVIIILYGVFNFSWDNSKDNYLWVLFLPLGYTFGNAFTSVIINNWSNSSKFKEGRVLRSLYNEVIGASFYSIIFSITIPIAIIFLFSLSYFDLKFWWALISLALSYYIFKGSGKGGWIANLLFRFKKTLFMVFILLFISLAFNGISNFLIQHVYPNHSIIWTLCGFSTNGLPLLISLGSFVVILILGFIVDSNMVSPHYFYRDRLTEAYLQTDARIKRKESFYKSHQGMPLVNVRNHEDLTLSDLGNGNGRGPYHIIVAALNLQGSDELNRKKMLSEHFIFSKYYVGSNVTGFVKTEVYRDGLTKLGRAMAISAAAAGSAMGQHSFGAQAFASTLFNARLGYWMANPWHYIRGNKNPEPLFAFWPKWVLLEMLGRITARGKMVNLSDGGHTGDNLGLMPLLQRKCKVIAVCDGEADLGYKFESFNNAVRMASIEEDIRIDINLSSIIPEKKDDGSYGLSKKSVAIGDIIYPPEKEGEPETYGKLIYIKSSLSEDNESLPVHVNNYRVGHPHFPHQSTADQFFDDAQFEAYRALGDHICEQAIKEMEEEEIIKKGQKEWAASF